MAASLIAHSRRLPTATVDLLKIAGDHGVLYSREGRGLAGQGIALRVNRSDVERALGEIECHGDLDHPGVGPIGFGALPFLPGASCEFIVPELIVCVDDHGAWATTIRPADQPPLEPVSAAQTAIEHFVRPAPSDGPASFQVEASRPPALWQQAVRSATERIRSGELDKVVLAREVVITADTDISISTVLTRLSQQYPGCFLYLVSGFCGASPELLVARSADVVTAQPMAGTKPRRADREADAQVVAELMSSATYRHEHQVTIDAVHDTLLDFCSYVDYEPEPSVVPLANVVHLATNVEGRLSHPPASILDLVSALHPTPAVCGRPRDVALKVISELEELDRGPYAGAVGWVDRHGNGSFAVSIRGAEISDRTARVIAGNGMVADSDPPTELIETRAKLQAMLSAIVRP